MINPYKQQEKEEKQKKKFKKLQNKTLAQVCDGLEKVCKQLVKDEQKQNNRNYLLKQATQFHVFAELFRNFNKKG